MALKLFLNSKTILEHTFPLIDTNAYDAEEVDRFLDMVIQDYKMAETNALISLDEYSSLKDKAKTLEMEKRQLEVECEKYKARFTNIKSSDNVTTDNIELVKKINALEKFLWSNGFNPNTIK
ncbi:MAG: DivIVA domain-containing protein [Erysipelotrichaceae bacterium]|jgi:DivIVA domain-containing protein|nr:DivIVA domain-containing protein [Erysipelotrichaceae bacterium]